MFICLLTCLNFPGAYKLLGGRDFVDDFSSFNLWHIAHCYGGHFLLQSIEQMKMEHHFAFLLAIIWMGFVPAEFMFGGLEPQCGSVK
jgi:hypothetical protein